MRVIRFSVLKGFSQDGLDSLFEGMEKIFMAEEGIRIGGFSQMLQGILSERGLLLPTRILAIEDRFIPHGSTTELFNLLKLDGESMAKEVEEYVKA